MGSSLIITLSFRRSWEVSKAGYLRAGGGHAAAIASRRVDIGVTHEVSNHLEILACFEEVRDEGPAEVVGGEGLEPGSLGSTAEAREQHAV